ncbi:LuxR C-terminal-related transcriptional regulator [uncultured Hymenobacter sp.]|uniref:helix-turn-helix transcriptional regulator n=1 Tax=uncultured Hymenobacter sp. TaxID=170016 RepID=UPI0035CC3AFE
MTVSTPTVLVAAAPTLFRQGLLALFREHWPQLALTLTADATQVAELAGQRPFRLIVLDGALLPRFTLPALLGRLHRARPSQRLLVLADPRPLLPGPPPTRPNAQLLVPRHVLPQTLTAALAPWLDAAAADAAPAYPPRRAQAHPLPDPFSPRELEVLRLVVDDHCNEEIADRLCLSVRTVESHRRTLLHKAGTRTLVGLVARAVREGWVA